MKHIIEKTISMAQDLGIEQCDVIANESKSLSLTTQNATIETYKVNSSQVFGVRVIQGQRVGISYSEDATDASLKTMLESALRSSRFAEVDEHQTITQPKSEIIDRNPKTFQEDHTDLKKKQELTLFLESEVKKLEPKTASIPYNGYGEGESHHHYGNHHGLYTYEREKTFSCYTSSLMKDGAKQAFSFDSMIARTFGGLNAEEAVKNALYKTRVLLDATPVQTGSYDIIFDSESLQKLLGCFVGQFSGKSVKDGVSTFRDSIGKSIAHPEFTLRDLPHFEQGFACALTDSEGMLKKDLTLIEKGELKTFYHNSQTANYFGVSNTGHASRSAKGHLGTSLTQLCIDAGSASNETVLNGKTIHIFSLEGLHAGVKPTSGDFSLAASGQLYENGQVIQGVKGITLSGNFFRMLSEINAIGKVVHSSSDQSFFAPDIRFAGIKVAGN
jgi:PmbA protein